MQPAERNVQDCNHVVRDRLLGHAVGGQGASSAQTPCIASRCRTFVRSVVRAVARRSYRLPSSGRYSGARCRVNLQGAPERLASRLVAPQNPNLTANSKKRLLFGLTHGSSGLTPFGFSRAFISFWP